MGNRLHGLWLPTACKKRVLATGLWGFGLLIGLFFWETPYALLRHTVVETANLGWKTTLWGEHLDGTEWKKSVLVLKSEIHFEQDELPVPDIQETFRCRMDGRFNVTRSGNYKVISRARGGVRIWINDILIVDAWRPVFPEYNKSRRDGVVQLEEGTYPIRIETIHREQDSPRFKVTYLYEDELVENLFETPWVYQP